MFIKFENSMTPKKAFYSMASKAELTDVYAKARFKTEPWYLTDMKLRKEAFNENRSSNNDGADGV